MGSSIILFLIIAVLFLFARPSLFSKKALLPKVQQQVQATNPTPVVSSPVVTAPQLAIAIAALQKRTYSPVALTTVQTIPGGTHFSSQIISFVVDGYREYARVDMPTTAKPQNGYPIMLLDHGYVVPSQYSTINSYAGIEDFFAANGYIVVKPDYRGNGNSQGSEDALARYNYPVDVMTLLVSLKNIPSADTSKICLWGHSMGGEVTLTVLEILGSKQSLGKNVKAAVLWAPVTDPAKWFSEPNLSRIPEAKLTPFPYTKTFQILGQPSESSPIWQSINPLNFLTSITVPIQINHGTGDTTVAYSSSQDLVQKLQSAGKVVNFISYPNADHNLNPDETEALENNFKFFQSH